MKSKIFLYLFLFTALLLFFQLYNANAVLRHSTNKQKEQLLQMDVLRDSLAALQIRYQSTAFHDLKKQKINANLSEEEIRQTLLQYNLLPDNPLIPNKTADGKFLLNNILVLNSKWRVAGCSNGTESGQLLLTYRKATDGKFQFQPEDFILF